MNGQNNLMNGSGTPNLKRFGGFILLVLVFVCCVFWSTSREQSELSLASIREPERPTMDRQQFTEVRDRGGAVGAAGNNAGSPKGTFDFPFLGRIESTLNEEEIMIQAPDGRSVPFRFRVFTDERGWFRRAEYAQDGTSELELSVSRIEEAMQATSERVLGFPNTPPATSWSNLVAAIAEWVPIDEIKRLNVTYVEYQRLDEPPSPVFIVNVYGVNAMPPVRYRVRDAKWDRTRFIANTDGEVVIIDDCL